MFDAIFFFFYRTRKIWRHGRWGRGGLPVEAAIWGHTVGLSRIKIPCIQRLVMGVFSQNIAKRLVIWKEYLFWLGVLEGCGDSLLLYIGLTQINSHYSKTFSIFIGGLSKLPHWNQMPVYALHVLLQNVLLYLVNVLCLTLYSNKWTSYNTTLCVNKCRCASIYNTTNTLCK